MKPLGSATGKGDLTFPGKSQPISAINLWVYVVCNSSGDFATLKLTKASAGV
jgi:hypothetical protein